MYGIWYIVYNILDEVFFEIPKREFHFKQGVPILGFLYEGSYCCWVHTRCPWFFVISHINIRVLQTMASEIPMSWTFSTRM